MTPNAAACAITLFARCGFCWHRVVTTTRTILVPMAELDGLKYLLVKERTAVLQSPLEFVRLAGRAMARAGRAREQCGAAIGSVCMTPGLKVEAALSW